jgi:hypothetical protein
VSGRRALAPLKRVSARDPPRYAPIESVSAWRTAARASSKVRDPTSHAGCVWVARPAASCRDLHIDGPEPQGPRAFQAKSHSRGRGFDSPRLHSRFCWVSALTAQPRPPRAGHSPRSLRVPSAAPVPESGITCPKWRRRRSPSPRRCGGRRRSGCDSGAASRGCGGRRRPSPCADRLPRR